MSRANNAAWDWSPSGLMWTSAHFTTHRGGYKRKKKGDWKTPRVSCSSVEPLRLVWVCVFCIWHSSPHAVILSRWLTLLSKYGAVNYHLTAALYAALPTEQDHRAQRDTTTLANKLDGEAKPGDTGRTKVNEGGWRFTFIFSKNIEKVGALEQGDGQSGSRTPDLEVKSLYRLS